MRRKFRNFMAVLLTLALCAGLFGNLSAWADGSLNDIIIVDEESDELSPQQEFCTAITTEKVKVGQKSYRSTTAASSEDGSGSSSEHWLFRSGNSSGGLLRTLDISAMAENGAVRFWIYVEDTATLHNWNGSQVQFGSGGWDRNTFAWSDWHKQIVNDGWNEIILPFSNAGTVGGEVDTSAMTWFFIRTNNVEYKTTVYLDNIRVTCDCVPEETDIVLATAEWNNEISGTEFCANRSDETAAVGKYSYKATPGNVGKTDHWILRGAYVAETSDYCRFVNFGTQDTLSYYDPAGNVKAVFDENERISIQTEFENYDRCERSPDRKVIYNVADYGADTTETEDISEILQSVIDTAYAEGGGIVYLPSNDYILQNPITVKSGVELRGSFDNPHFATVLTTTFVTDYGKNDEFGKALITLESNSGMKGITVDYSEPRPNNILPYAYTIRGAGSNIYVINCTVDTAYQVLDLKTNACDNHYVEAVNFGTLKTGIAVGGGSQNGVIRDCQSNPTSNRDSRNNDRSAWFDQNGACLSVAYCAEHVTGYTIDNAVNELYYMNFIYGCVTGIEITGNTTANIICPGVDQSDYGIYIDDNAEVSVISAELPTRMSTESYAIYLADGYKGKTNVVSAAIWAVGKSGIYCGGGELNAVNLILFQSGQNAIEVKGGNAVLAGSAIIRNSYANYRVVSDNATLNVFGNSLLDNNYAVSNSKDRITGSGKDDVEITVVSSEKPQENVFFDTSMILNTDYFMHYSTNFGERTDDGEKYVFSSLDGNHNPIINICRTDSIDVSGSKFLEFDYYISDISLFEYCGGNMQLELSSSNLFDVDEIIWNSDYFNSQNLTEGWNHVKLSLDSYKGSSGNFDISKIIRLRIYYVLNGNTAAGEMRIKNIMLTDGNNVPANAINFGNGADWINAESFSYENIENAHYSNGLPMMYYSPNTDISDKQYFSLMLWISDADLFNKECYGTIELTSSSIYDIAEISYNLSILKGSLKTGWNYVTIPLSCFKNSGITEELCDITAINFFRIYTNSYAFGIALADMKLY